MSLDLRPLSTSIAWRIAGCLIGLSSGCGPSAAQQWSDLPNEEQLRRLVANLERGEIHVAPFQGELKPAQTVPKGEPYRAFGEVRFADPKASMLGPVIFELHKVPYNGMKSQRNNIAFMDYEEGPPGVYKFTVFFDPIAEPGKYTIRIKYPGKDTIQSRQFENRITADEFAVE